METITITKTYTKQEAFERFLNIYGNTTKTEEHTENSEYNTLIDFLGISELVIRLH